MKRIFLFSIAAVSILGAAGISNAALILDNGVEGTVTQVRNDGSRLMWLQDASLSGNVNWDDANDWIDDLNELNEGAGYAGFNDWRLPNTLPISGGAYNVPDGFPMVYDGTSERGYNVTDPNSEVAYMYHVELGNLSYFPTDYVGPSHPLPSPPAPPFYEGQPGWGLQNSDVFDNLMAGWYWSGQDMSTIAQDIYPIEFGDYIWDFNFADGHQGGTHRSYIEDYSRGVPYDTYAWAVRDMTPVPIPSPIWLLGAGLIGLAGIREKLRKA